MADVALVSRAIAPAPKDYTVPGSQEFFLKAVRARVDGTAASSPFLVVLEMLSPDGTVMWDAPTTTTVAAGASVSVSWFPDVEPSATAASSSSGGTISDVTSTGGSISVTAPTGPTTNVDVASSGVAAATYGDASHVAQFHVGADGRVTSASNIGITGIAGNGLLKVFDSTLGAPAASIDTGVGGISSGGGVLYVYFDGATADAGAATNVDIRVNNDSGSNYDAQIWYENAVALGNGNAVGTAQWKLIGHGAGGTANYSGGIILTIPGYDGTTFFKTGIAQSWTIDAAANGNNFVAHYGVGWRSTSAISRLAVFADSGANLATGSRLQIYRAQ